jgi:SET domain-containing protein
MQSTDSPTPPWPTSAEPPTGLVTWRPIAGKGRGVVAVTSVKKGTELERSPVIVVPLADLVEREDPPTVPHQYLLDWLDEPGHELVMGGGLLMIYNHSDAPNVEFWTGPDGQSMSVFAIRDIESGEELVYDYGVPLRVTPAA